MKRGLTLIFIIVFLVIAPGVLAHAELVAAEPEPGAQLADAPAEIRLTFSEPIAAQSDIIVLGEGFAPVEGLVPQLGADRPEQVYAPLPPLEPGPYTVQWTAVSADGHEISGSYSFSIRQDDGATAVTEPTAEQPAAGMGIIGWFLALAAVALVVPFLFFWYRHIGRKA